MEEVQLDLLPYLQSLEILEVSRLKGSPPFQQRHFDALSGLRRLEITESEGVHPEVLRNLTCNALECFHINGSDVNNEVLGSITGNCPYIQKMYIYQGPFSDLEPLLRMEHLKDLELNCCENISGAGGGVEVCSIERLYLTCCKLHSLEFLRSFHSLRALRMYQCRRGSTEWDFRHLAPDAPLDNAVVFGSSAELLGFARCLADRNYPIRRLKLGCGSPRDDGVTLEVATLVLQSIPTLRLVVFYGNQLDDTVFDLIQSWAETERSGAGFGIVDCGWGLTVIT